MDVRYTCRCNHLDRKRKGWWIERESAASRLALTMRETIEASAVEVEVTPQAKSLCHHRFASKSTRAHKHVMALVNDDLGVALGGMAAWKWDHKRRY